MRGPLRRTSYAASWPLASQHSLHPPHLILLLLPSMLLGDCANACCFQCLLCAVVTRHRPGPTFALHRTAPLQLNLHRKPVRPVPKGTCCRPLEEVCRGGISLDMGCKPSVPRIIYGSPPSKMSDKLFFHKILFIRSLQCCRRPCLSTAHGLQDLA